MINSTGTGFILSVSDLTQYIRCVVDEYFELIRDFRLHDGAPPSLAVAMAERKQGYDLKAVRSSILKTQCSQQAEQRSDDAPASGGSKKKRQRPRERKPARPPKSDSDSSSSDDDEPAAPPKPKPSAGGGGGSKGPVAAFPQLKPVGAAVRDKALAEMRTKYRKHCTSFLLGKCTRDT